MTTDVYTRLSEPFPPEMEREITKSGTRLTYIPVSEVITRMNAVIGVGNWSSEVVKVERDHLDPDFIVAHVRVTAIIGDVPVVKDGLGGQTIKRKKNGEIVDLGDEYKGAVSDAFKKACQMFGVGLYLARSEDAMEVEAAMAVASTESRADAESASVFAALRTHLDKMDNATKASIKQWWAATFPGASAPSATSDPEMLKAAIAWCIESKFQPEQGAA